MSPRHERRNSQRRQNRWMAAGGTVALIAAMASAAPLVQPTIAAAAVGNGPWVLSTTDTSTNYAPTFIGNGYFAARIPAEGAGFSTSPVLIQSQLAGFYTTQPGGGQFTEMRASIPTWTTLGLSDG